MDEDCSAVASLLASHLAEGKFFLRDVGLSFNILISPSGTLLPRVTPAFWPIETPIEAALVLKSKGFLLNPFCRFQLGHSRFLLTRSVARDR